MITPRPAFRPARQSPRPDRSRRRWHRRAGRRRRPDRSRDGRASRSALSSGPARDAPGTPDACGVHDAEVARCHAAPRRPRRASSRGSSLTSMRSSRSSRFTSDDLPAFGRPTIAMRTSGSWWRSVVPPAPHPVHARGCFERADALTISSSRSSTPVAVLAGNLDNGVEAELVELDGRVARRADVRLVDGCNDRACRRPHLPHDLEIAGHQPFLAHRRR